MIEGKISQANGRLKAANIGLAIERRGDRLILRGTLPPKPGSNRTKPFQQRITLRLRANPVGVSSAEKEARLIDALLQQGRFSWEPYLRETAAAPLTVGDWIERFERDYFTRRKRTPQSETTWRYDYLKALGKLPQGELLTAELLRNTIEATEPDTRTRKRFVDVLTRLGQFAGLEVDFKSLRGDYSPAKVTPRNLPSDALIAECREQIPNPLWQRTYGLIAAYGLRPHEVFNCSLKSSGILEIFGNTKTGSRMIYPYYPEWTEQWELEGELPQCSGRNNTDLGQRVTRQFSRYKLPFTPYDLRHAWAVRTIKFGLPDTLAARQMGHSVQVHCSIYHAWISGDEMERMNQLLMTRSDRPLPP